MRIIHVFYPGNDQSADVAARNANAAETWATIAAADPGFASHRADPRRNSAELGDPSPVPYLRDIIDHGAAIAPSDPDIILYSNADICFVPEAADEIRRFMQSTPVTYGYRGAVVDATIKRRLGQLDEPDGGIDWCAFGRGWWLQNRLSIPDFLIGRWNWDDYFKLRFDALPGLLCYHQSHMPYWMRHMEEPGQKHNRRLYENALAEIRRTA